MNTTPSDFDVDVSGRIDTDASGQPCIVAHPVRRQRRFPTRTEIADAFRRNRVCVQCDLPIASVDEAALVVTANRVAHRERCLVRYLGTRFGFSRKHVDAPNSALEKA